VANLINDSPVLTKRKRRIKSEYEILSKVALKSTKLESLPATNCEPKPKNNFRPTIDQNSQKMARRVSDVHQHLHSFDYKEVKERRIIEREQHLALLDQKECTFAPKLTRMASNLHLQRSTSSTYERTKKWLSD